MSTITTRDGTEIYVTDVPTMDHLANLESVDAQVTLDRVPCPVCRHEIPTSEALIAEATDYVVYFCGLDCYERWRNQQSDH